ncbi:MULTISPECIES: ESX secretion-associated protein EspG [Amycolatopsis]|uniref:ESAT-6 protein secretion system EspG family protein n=1 Tax=Amycolatopsis thermoflava TaxID=84480 RepID=A0A3N2GY55_9PSEU|nr:ESX secretion-associated protein EspG [Amycolatopsis thermoflava]ROS41616.1 ESAT-6 protein secretion system EspG family protein [Amycolatopsis thermoflava]
MNRPEFFTPMTFDFLWEAAGIGELPYPLQVRSHGATMDERARLRQRAHEELKARGLRDHYGRLDPRVEDWFRVLAQGSTSIDAVHIPDFQVPPVSILAATDGTLGVVAIQDADGIWIRPAFPEGLASTVVDLLPPGTRGTEASITLPVDEALRIQPARAAVPVGGDPKPRRRSLSEGSSDPREAYARLAGQPRLRGGQLAANSRSEVSGRRRSPVLGWFDTATGRYLSLSRPGADGREWVTVSSADAKTLRTRLGEMVAGVTTEPGN